MIEEEIETKKNTCKKWRQESEEDIQEEVLEITEEIKEITESREIGKREALKSKTKKKRIIIEENDQQTENKQENR